MNDLNFFSALIIGLAGGIHCVGMCGGIVAALSYGIPKGKHILPYTLSYNIGRITSYTLAGLLTGWLGNIFASQVNQGLVVLQFVSSIFLFLLALYITGLWQGLTKIELLGSKLWSVLRPYSAALLPFKHPLYTLPYGLIWGWLPCGLVYSVLTWSLASGSALEGGIIMFGFGLGTLPVMLLMAMGFNKVRALVQHFYTKILMGVLLAAFASLQMAHLVMSTVK